MIPEDANIEWIKSDVFEQCELLSEISLPSSIKYIDDNAFSGCTSLESINIPENVIEIGQEAFHNAGLKTVNFNSKLKYIWGYAFASCPLTTLIIPASVKRIGGSAFGFNEQLKEVYFKGDAPLRCTEDNNIVPIIGQSDDEDPFKTYENTGTPFIGCENEITAYIPAGNSTWTDDVKFLYEHDDPDYVEPEDPDMDDNYDPHITWETWVPSRSSSAGKMSYNSNEIGLSLMAYHYGGWSERDGVYTSEFDELIPGEEYVFTAVKDSEAADPLNKDNLLYIWQDTASDSGTLSFTYMLPEMDDEFEGPEVILYGAGGEDITSNYEVSLYKKMYNYTGSRIYPKVLFDDEEDMLEEGTDYELSGNTSALNPGTYELTVTGKGEFYGSVTFTYQIVKADPVINMPDRKIAVGQKINAVESTNYNGDMKYKSSDSKVAVVDENGKVTAKKPGTATISVTSEETNGFYGSIVSMKLTVVPKPVKLVSAKNLRGRKVKATWKKESSITGYELQYSLKKNFKGGKIKVIKKAKTTKLTIKKLLKKKTYYFRVRTYKKIGKKMYRSKWSNVKKVKIKK